MRLRLVVAAALAAWAAAALAAARGLGGGGGPGRTLQGGERIGGGGSGGGGGGERGPSPEDMGLRPDAAFAFEFPRLQEPEGKQYDPRARDLNNTALQARLGAHFDPRFMSIHRPRNHSQLGFPFRHQKGGKHGAGRLAPAPGAEMPPFLRRMNFRSLRLPNGTRLRTHVSPRLQKKLQHFLWAWTACPVLHTWRDMGVRYWPRYLVEGSCPSGRGSCSVPPGMKCTPAQRVLKVILRWQCSPSGAALAAAAAAAAQGAAHYGLDGGGGGGGGGGLHCQWMEINNYPIVTGCSCGCPSQNGS